MVLYRQTGRYIDPIFLHRHKVPAALEHNQVVEPLALAGKSRRFLNDILVGNEVRHLVYNRDSLVADLAKKVGEFVLTLRRVESVQSGNGFT